MGSNPTGRTNNAPIVQLERATGFYPVSVGSNPTRRAIGETMELALVIGLITMGLFGIVYFGIKYVNWAIDINLPEGEMRDPDE